MLTTKIDLRLHALLTNVLDLSSPTNNALINPVIDLADGAGINAANRVYQASGSVGSAGEVLIDLTALTDPLGGAVSFARVKAIYLRNKSSTAADNLQLTAPSEAGISTLFVAVGDGIIVGPGGLALLANPSAAGWAVTATTADILRIGNPGANAIAYDLVIVGAAT